MVGAVNSSGYQAYSYQQATTPVQESPRGGDNRVEKRDAPAPDSQRTGRRDERSASNDDRGNNLDVEV